MEKSSGKPIVKLVNLTPEEARAAIKVGTVLTPVLLMRSAGINVPKALINSFEPISLF